MLNRLRIDRTAILWSHLVLAPLALSFACEANPDDEEEEEAGNIAVRDANNYSSVSSLDIPAVVTASGVDIDVCWPNIVDDIQCHPVDPVADLNNMTLVRFPHLSQEEVEQRLAQGELAQSELNGYLEYHTGNATCAKLSQLNFLGTDIAVDKEYDAALDQTYMLSFTTGTAQGVGTRTMVFLTPSVDSVNTMVDVTQGCGILQFTADLSSLTPVTVPRSGPWVVDWREATVDGQGNPLEKVDGVLLGYYQGMTPADLQAKILDLELIATTLWELDVPQGKTADLTQATAADGSRFSGFVDGGTWVLGLMCSTCQNPAPRVLTILQPTEGE
ncbi:MAG: hypothetical protein B7733_04420 [Myxococcales bacterium FL481]|nr:MAG: hypothetical protein B7733_04420 [Myxococcales bacterium FL481]